MKSLSLWILLFALLSLLFFILLILLRNEFPLYPLLSYQDAFDLLTPLVLIPIYGLLFRYAAPGARDPAEDVAFLALVALWVAGQGMHLSANSISNLMEAQAHSGLLDLDGNDVFRLTHFYDEFLSHFLWHAGILGLAGLLIYSEWHRPAALATVWWSTLLAGVIYGFTLFAITNEGQTVWLGLPFTLLVLLLGLVRGRGKLRERPLLAFFLVACVVAFLLYSGWGLYWRGFPEFGDVGLI